MSGADGESINLYSASSWAMEGKETGLDSSNVRVIVDGVVLEGRCSIGRMKGIVSFVGRIRERVREKDTP